VERIKHCIEIIKLNQGNAAINFAGTVIALELNEL
jgi:hypothetical protein